MHKKNNPSDVNAKKYRTAIGKYNNLIWYRKIQMFTSIAIMALQALTTIQLFYEPQPVTIVGTIITIVIAYVLTDFINGLVHMIMDNHTNYTSMIGPFVAAFHLHHNKLTYPYKYSIQVYFYESGQKYWLLFYLILLLIAQHYFNLNVYINLSFVLIGILSSAAEVSHFWCHRSTKNNALIRFLQKYRILLSMNHHGVHHSKDNINYAFLNGMTDPLLNKIANFFCKGYKNYADQYVSNGL